MNDSEDSEAEDRRRQLRTKKQESDPPQSELSEQADKPRRRKTTKPKKRKEKKIKKKKVVHESEQDEQDEKVRGIREMLDDEAQQDSEEEEDDYSDYEAELNKKEVEKYRQLYKVNHKRQTQKFIEKFNNKSPHQINTFYQNQIKGDNIKQRIKFRPQDDRLFSVACHKGSQQDLVLSILNKARYCAQNPGSYKCNITSVFCQKKLKPGLLFIEAAGQLQVKEALSTFTDVYINKLKEEDKNIYNTFFSTAVKRRDFTQQQIVRIKKGVYKGDLAKIIKVYNTRVRALIVPRVDLKLMAQRMKEAQSRLQDKELLDHKNLIFRKLTDPKVVYPQSSRPQKQPLQPESFKSYNDLVAVKKLTISDHGLLVLCFPLSDIEKPTGTILPIQIEPFSLTGNVIREFQEDPTNNKIILGTTLNNGQDVEVMVGQLTGAFGKVVYCGGGKVTFKCHNRELKDMIIDEIADHVEKRFAQGTKVIVSDGANKGHQGTVLKTVKSSVFILTSNNHQIEALRRNVEKVAKGGMVQENPFNFIINDVIKTTTGEVGIVLDTSKNYIKILNLNNQIKNINNLDCGSKVNTRGVTAKNRYNETIQSQSIIKIVQGTRAGEVCQVKCVYQGYLFLQSKDLNKTQGVSVEKADRCKMVLDVFRRKKNQPQDSVNKGGNNFGQDKAMGSYREQEGEDRFMNRNMQTPFVGASMKTGFYTRQFVNQ